MVSNDAERFTLVMLTLGEVFKEEITAARMNAYKSALSDLSIDQIEKAASRLIAEAVFFPKPVEIRNLIKLSSDDRAEMAWRTFAKLVGNEGEYPSLYFDDLAISFAINHMGGWLAACDELRKCSPEMYRAAEYKFKTSYRLALQAEQAGPRHFAGFYEATNRSQIGSMDRAKGRTVEIEVCLVRTSGYERLRVPFDLDQGMLTEKAHLALEAGKTRDFSFQPAVLRALPPVPKGPPMTEENIKVLRRQIEEMTGKRMPQAGKEVDA